MPIRPDAPLRKVTMNFYAEDVEWLQREYGDGWTERIRQHIHNEVRARKTKFIFRLGDLSDD